LIVSLKVLITLFFHSRAQIDRRRDLIVRQLNDPNEEEEDLVDGKFCLLLTIFLSIRVPKFRDFSIREIFPEVQVKYD